MKVEEIQPIIQLAIQEDLGKADITSELLFTEDAISKSNIVSREEIVVCGMLIAKEVLKRYDPRLKLKINVRDGQTARAGRRIGVIEGPLRSMLSAERVMLNFLQRLSGIATATKKYVKAIQGTKARICDTRKTTPGWRILEKYAVRCGGGHNHRMGLYDAVLIKDNHLAQLGADFYPKLRKIIERARMLKGAKFIAVEVDRVEDQLNYVLKIPGIDIVLLDNMGPQQLKRAVGMRNEICGKGKKPLLEATGKVTLRNVSKIARCGVDRIAIGAITHSATAVDIGLDI
jgi:nicotinate-nucleotide pyrophosphorylase (carboxylating)